MRRFSAIDKHYDRHNEGICSVCGCTTARWKFMCDVCRKEKQKEQEEKLKAQEEKLKAQEETND